MRFGLHVIFGRLALLRNAQIKKAAKKRLPRVIAISSGKGGVGKSSVTVNLAISLAKGGARVCVLDADTGLANANILLGLVPKYGLEHVLFSAKKIEDIMLEGPHGVKIIPGANGISECVTLHPRQQLRLTQELTRIEGEFDFLLIDTAAGIASSTLDFVCASQCALIVITPEPTSLTDAFSMVKLLKRRRGKVSFQVLVNMCRDENEHKEVFRRFYSAVKKYIGVEVESVGFIPRDETMQAAVLAQNPVVLYKENSPSSRSFLQLAQKLQNPATVTTVPSSFSAYWNRRFKRKRLEEEPVKIEAGSKLSEEVSGDYLSELRSRLLLLIEQGQSDPLRVKSTIQDALTSYVRRYDQEPVDLLELIEALVASSTRDHSLLRKIAAQVKPWVELDTFTSDEHNLPVVGNINEKQTEENARSHSTDCIGSDKGRIFGRVPKLAIDNTYSAGLSNKSASTAKISMAEIPLVEELFETQAIVPPHKDSIKNHHEETELSVPTPVSVSAPSVYRAHEFNVNNFGSQEQLLEVLRRHRGKGKTLGEILATLRE